MNRVSRWRRPVNHLTCIVIIVLPSKGKMFFGQHGIFVCSTTGDHWKKMSEFYHQQADTLNWK